MMASLPLTIDDDTRNLVDGLERRQKDLTDFQVPRLRQFIGSLVEQERLAAELKEDLDVFGRQVEALSVRLNDYAKKVDRNAILQLVNEFKGASLKIRKDMRVALLHSKKNIDAQAKTDREKLFQGANIDTRIVEEKATDDALMKASNDVTDALRRTIGLMQNELERSVLSHQILEQSTSTLRSTSTQHDILTSATNTSKQLITALEKADWLDRLLVLAALMFFILVVLFILKQRVLDRGLKIAFWWTRYLPQRKSSEETVMQVAKAGLENLGSAKEPVKATMGSVSSALSSVFKAAETTASQLGESVLEAVSVSAGVVSSKSKMGLESLGSTTESVKATMGSASSALSSTFEAAEVIATELEESIIKMVSESENVVTSTIPSVVPTSISSSMTPSIAEAITEATIRHVEL